MTTINDVQSPREEFVQGYRDGFRSVQGSDITPVTPSFVLESGSSPYDQGYVYGVRDGGGN